MDHISPKIISNNQPSLQSLINEDKQSSAQLREAEQVCLAVSLMAENRYGAAVPILKELAEESNNSDAQNLLGDLYFCGIGVDEQNFSEATKYYEQAAQNGDASSSNNLGYAVQYGLKDTQKFEPKPHEAMTHYMQALVTTGRANNENNDFIEGILQNLMKKIEFTVNIYDSGEHLTPHSYFLQIAGEYEYRHAPDLLTAFAIVKNAYLLKGGKLGFFEVQALNELQGKILASAKDDFKNRHYPQVYKKLFFLAKDSHVTKENQATALRLLGKMYCQGLGVAQDIKQAINYLNVPAKQGDKQACFLLGEIYSSDTEHFDYEEAMYWYQQAGAEDKIEPLKLKIYESAMQNLIDLGAEKAGDKNEQDQLDDINLGFAKLKFLAKEGDAKAQCKLGEINLKWGTQGAFSNENHQYFTLALQYFQDAIKNRYQPAYFMAGQALEKMGPSEKESKSAHHQKLLAFYDLEDNLCDSEINRLGQVSFAVATILSQSDEDKDKLKLIAQDNPRTGKSYLEEAALRGHPTALNTMFALSEKYLNQYENASPSQKNKVDFEVGTRLFEFALAQDYPQAIEKKEGQEQAKTQQIEQEKKAAQEVEENRQSEREQREKEWDEISKSFSAVINTIGSWFSSDKSLKNPLTNNQPAAMDIHEDI